MKKTVLMLIAVGTWVYAGAQTSTQKRTSRSAAHTKPVQLKRTKISKNDPPSFYKQAINEKTGLTGKGVSKKPQAINGAPCGSAANLYGILNSNTTAVTVDQNLGAILFTHREDFSKLTAHGSGTYEASYSLNMGASWDTSKLIYANAATSSNGTRYPNGIVFNPNGNTTFTNAYWVVNGPYTNGNTTAPYQGWDSTAFGSMKFDSTNISAKFKGNGKPGVLTEEFCQYMSGSDDSTAHSVGDGDYFNSAITSSSYTGTSLNTGKFNSTNHNFNWTQKLFRPHLMPGGGLTAYDTLAQRLGDAGTAWSQDGKTGYVVIFGNLDSTDAVSGANLNFASFQPIVYKTTNSGASWAMMPIHNWDNDDTLKNYLPQAQDSNVVVPLWGLYYTEQGGDDDYDLVVDANNNLHIIGGIHGSTIATPDSSDYIGYYLVGNIFDIYTTTATGGWTARFVAPLAAVPTQVSNDGVWVATTADPLAMGHRIQTSRTLDGTKIFVTWLDDSIDVPATGGIDSIQFPDMFGRGYDVTTGVSTPIKSFTFNKSLPQSEGDYYICVSDKPLVTGTSGSQTYQIPVVRVAPPSGTNDGTSPVSFLYDSSDVYTDADFIPQGIQNVKPTTFTITPNYPNPFNGITRFGVNLTKESLVNVDVFNMVGQKMVTMSPEKLSPGTHTIAINGSGFASGVYFYRVTVDGTSLTQKMIVE